MKIRTMPNLYVKIVATIVLLEVSIYSFASLPDSVRSNVEDFDYLTRFTENNLATYPYIIKDYSKEYVRLKKNIRKHLLKGQDIESATCDYVFWFFSQFDTHFIVACHKFWDQYDLKVHVNYRQLMNYNPQPVAQMIDSMTYLVRVPSCSGGKPSYGWVDSAAIAYRKSNCPNLIIDVRGNTGGNDGIWAPFFDMLADHKPVRPWTILFRNTKKNIETIATYGMNKLVERAQKTNSLFVPMDNEDDEVILPKSYPVKIAVIVDSRTASSAETLVNFIRDYCSRGKIYGRENTSGANMTGNVAPFKLPHSGITCYYPMCVDNVFSQQVRLRKLGISPDVKITLPLPSSLQENVDSWTLWVANNLEKH